MRRYLMVFALVLLTVAQAQVTQGATPPPNTSTFDPVFYFPVPQQTPASSSGARLQPFGINQQLSLSTATRAGSNLYRRKLAAWRDPLTIQTRQNGRREYWDVLFGKLCVKPIYETRFLDNELYLVITAGIPVTLEQLQREVEAAIKDAAVAGIIATIAGCYTTGCAASLPVAIEAFKAVLIARLTTSAANIDVRTETASSWSNWAPI